MKTKTLQADVVIAGGGIAGTMAAIAAAREGARTILVERYTALGGMATLGLVQPITTWGINGHYVVGGTGKTILEHLAQNPAAATPVNLYGPSCDPEWLKYTLERTAIEHGVHILYHVWVREAHKRPDGTLMALTGTAKGADVELEAEIFVDATGDADVAALCDAPCDVGNQGISLMFIVAGIDRERCPDKTQIAKIYNSRKVGYRSLALFWHPRPGAAYFNVTEVEKHDPLSATDLTKATIDCRDQAWKILHIMRTHVPGFENAYIEQTAPALGVRESRRIRGGYHLTAADVTAGRQFDDVIARASCPVDIHGSEAGGKGQYGALKQSYAIPYRCLTPVSPANLLVTGRPISADHAAHSSLRRMGPGFALGEAAGIAAYMALETGDVKQVSIPQLQEKLTAYGAILAPEGNGATATE